MRTAQFDQLLHYFAENARQEGGRWVCFRYVREIAEALKRDRRTIQRWLRRLETLGLVRTELTFHRHGGNGPNRYVLRFSPRRPPAIDSQAARAVEERIGAEALKLEEAFLRLAERLRPDLPQKELRHRFAAFRLRYRERRLSRAGWLALWSAFLRQRWLRFEDVAPYLRLWFKRHYGDRPLSEGLRSRLRKLLSQSKEPSLLDWISLLKNNLAIELAL